MQISNPLKRNSSEGSAAEERIEPTIGSAKPSPWDVRPEAAPAFTVVGDEIPEEITLPEGNEIPGGESSETTPDEALAEIPPFDVIPENPREEIVTGEALPADAILAEEKEPVIPEMSSAEKGIEPLSMKEQPSRSEAQAAPEPKKGKGILSFLKNKKDEKAGDETEVMMTEEQLAMREKTRCRLIGAAVILMGVIVLSSFCFDNGDAAPQESTVSTDIPPVREVPQDFEPNSEVVAITPPVRKEALEDESASREERRAASEKKAAAKADLKKAEPDRIEKALAKADKKKTVSAVPSGSGYYVQVVVTSSERKADGMVADLNALGVHAYKTPHKTKAGMLWRVRIGLFKTKKEAEGVIGVLALNGYTGKHIIGKQ